MKTQRKTRKVQHCVICSCTEKRPCMGGCYWVTFNICSQCYELVELRRRLQAEKLRQPDAYSIIGAVSGFGEKRVREIAENAEPTFAEKTTLLNLSEG